ncbi:MAG TPA: MFS transporter [Gaiellaceae bacterium]
MIPLGALREREYRLFFAGQSVSLLGDGMVGVALSFAVLDLTGKAADLGYVFAARAVPLVGFLIVGGVFADRLSRRAVMVGADLVRCGTQGGLAVLLLTGHAQLWHVIVLQTIGGAATAFFNPSLTGLTPLLVTGEHLQQANVLRGLSAGVGGIAGPALAGVLVATVGSGWALAVDSATFAVSAAFLAALRLPPHERLPQQRFLRDLRDGWHEFSSRTWLWSGVVAAGIANMLSAPFFVLGAAIAKSDLGGAGPWALILSSFSAGALAGGMVALRLRPRRPFRASFIGYLPFGLPSLLLAFHAGAYAIAVTALIAGAGLMIGNALWETTLQRKIPAAALSRVTAYDWFGSLAGQPLGNALVGPAAATLGTTATLLLAAAVTTGSNLVVLSLPSIRAVTAED